MKIFPQQHQIKYEKINFVYDHLAAGLIMNILVGSVLFAAVYKVSGISQSLIWYASLLLVVSMRFILLFLYRRSKDKLIDLKRWYWAFVIGACLMGTVWGIAGVVLFPESDVARQIFLSFIIGGMAMGAVPSLAPLLPAYLLFLIPAELPINVYLFTFTDSLHIIIGIANILFCITMLVAAKLNQKNFIHNFMLRYVNEDLVKKLNDTNEELEQKIQLKNKIEQDLRENELRYKALSNAAHDGVILHKGNFIIEANEAAARMSGYPVKELIGKPVLRVIAEDCHEDIIQRLENSTDEIFETNCLRKDGTIFRAEINPDNVTYKGDPARIVSVRDVSKQKQIESDLLHAKNVAEEADKIKSEFLASVSHELRTPLNAIIGILQILEETRLTNSQHEYVEMGEKAARQLLLLINDLLDLSKIESGNIEYQYRDTNLNRLLYETVQIMSFKAKERHNEIKLVVEDNLPEFVNIEPDRLRQILLNLVGNAIKFTDAGCVVLKVGVKGTEQKTEMLYFVISDNGIGIPEEKQALIFNRFTQMDSSISRNYGGTGLGLAISRELLTHMGGEIGVVSHEGTGSTFWFTLPFSLASGEEITSQENTLQTVDKSLLKGLSVLVVEDEETNRIIAKKMLENIGCHVELLNDGQQAVEARKKYDLIFMDMQMPNMDGLEASRIMREKGLTTPIIALTANAMEDDRQRCLDAGMDDYLSKPVDIDSLVQVLFRWANKKKQSASG